MAAKRDLVLDLEDENPEHTAMRIGSAGWYLLAFMPRTSNSAYCGLIFLLWEISC
jgi:hypothetical protein